MNDVARAINIVQTATGCRVMLVPMSGEGKANNAPLEAILKPQESVSEPAKVTAAPKAKGARKALKCDSEIAEKPKKSARKAAKPDKAKADTFMTVAKFAEMRGCHFSTVHGAIKDGRIPAEMLNTTSGITLINTRCDWMPSSATNGIKVFCKETKMTFDSIAQATKGTGQSYYKILCSLRNGKATDNGMSFQYV